MDRDCVVCGAPFKAQRKSAKYCSRTCSARASRGVKTVPVVTQRQIGGVTEGDSASVTPLPDPPVKLGPVESALLEELSEHHRETTSLGRTALAMAHRVDEGRDLGSALAALAKQLEATRSAALAGVKSVQSPLDNRRDELAERRARQGA